MSCGAVNEQVKIQAGNRGAACMTDTPGGHQYVAARRLMWPLGSGEKRSGTKPGWEGQDLRSPGVLCRKRWGKSWEEEPGRETGQECPEKYRMEAGECGVLSPKRRKG